MAGKKSSKNLLTKRKNFSVAQLILFALVFAALGAIGWKTFASGKLTVTIDFSDATAVESTANGPMVSGGASFAVTRSFAYNKETIWVTNKCVDASGNTVTKQDNPVLWGQASSLSGTTWEFPTGGATCTAYVTLKPWTNRPYSKDAVINYLVR